MTASVGEGYFVTGTDTGVGKTRVAVALMHRLRSSGLCVAGMKPVATGCDRRGGRLRNDDAVRLQSASSVAADYELVNPYAFEPAIAPSIAAAEAGRPIEFDVILERFRELRRRSDVLVVEALGGWSVPLGPTKTVGDLAAAIGLPVILVVGLRLGALNHAILSEQAIFASGVRYRGWVANMLSAEFPHARQNVETLRQWLRGCCLGTLPFDSGPEAGTAAGAFFEL